VDIVNDSSQLHDAPLWEGPPDEREAVHAYLVAFLHREPLGWCRAFSTQMPRWV